MEARPVLVGRESEREALRAVIERATSGEPGLLLLHGEAGIGKTSLVREAAAGAGRGGCTSCSGSASGSARTSPATSRSHRPSRSGCAAPTARPATGSRRRAARTTSSPHCTTAPVGSPCSRSDPRSTPSRPTGRRSWWSTTCSGPTRARWTSWPTSSRGSPPASGWPSCARTATPTSTTATACTAGWPTPSGCRRCRASGWSGWTRGRWRRWSWPEAARRRPGSGPRTSCAAPAGTPTWPTSSSGRPGQRATTAIPRPVGWPMPCRRPGTVCHRPVVGSPSSSRWPAHRWPTRCSGTSRPVTGCHLRSPPPR
ncbi:AAA family ATPase [Phycicoccus sp. HDW14]|nr:AAA family ATPase [Phycicoccus sp. HDW14]